MCVSESGAPSKIVIDQCVLQQVVTHVESVVPAAGEDERPDTGDPINGPEQPQGLRRKPDRYRFESGCVPCDA
jgi:hypothetical protein